MVFSLKWANKKICYKQSSQDKYFLKFSKKNARIRHQQIPKFYISLNLSKNPFKTKINGKLLKQFLKRTSLLRVTWSFNFGLFRAATYIRFFNILMLF